MARSTSVDERPRVRLYPVPDWHLPGVRAVERLVPADVAEHLLATRHPAFTRERPADQADPSENPLEDISDILRAVPALRAPTATTTEAPAAADTEATTDD